MNKGKNLASRQHAVGDGDEDKQWWRWSRQWRTKTTSLSLEHFLLLALLVSSSPFPFDEKINFLLEDEWSSFVQMKCVAYIVLYCFVFVYVFLFFILNGRNVWCVGVPAWSLKLDRFKKRKERKE